MKIETLMQSVANIDASTDIWTQLGDIGDKSIKEIPMEEFGQECSRLKNKAAIFERIKLRNNVSKENKFKFPILENIEFNNCHFSYVDFNDTTLKNVKFKNCYLYDTSIRRSNLVNVTFDHTVTRNNSWVDKCVIDNLKIIKSIYDRETFRKCEIRNSELVDDVTNLFAMLNYSNLFEQCEFFNTHFSYEDYMYVVQHYKDFLKSQNKKNTYLNLPTIPYPYKCAKIDIEDFKFPPVLLELTHDVITQTDQDEVVTKISAVPKKNGAMLKSSNGEIYKSPFETITYMPLDGRQDSDYFVDCKEEQYERR